uniref:Uncharacterized protein n=1 Tax=Physcomitrium patens TaxID=3218 RepID=A0A2K1KUU2_PHYPA|nr:hypothetical protein PHYPA_004543 [Physcomitrium patens]
MLQIWVQNKGVSCNLLRVADLNRNDQPQAASSEARHREEEESRERGPSGSMDAFVASQRFHDDLKNTEESSTVQDVTPQPETLFAPKEAEESREIKPFKSIEADVGVDPLSQKIEMPSVRAPSLKSSNH